MIPQTIVRIADHQDEDGRIDWQSYREAKVRNGEDCQRCGQPIIPQAKARSDCFDCRRSLTEDGEVEHDQLIRCPSCRSMFKPDWEDDVWDGGTCEISCRDCDHDFEVESHVSVSFTSPRMEAGSDD